jgi:glutamyl-tRNA reductase
VKRGLVTRDGPSGSQCTSSYGSERRRRPRGLPSADARTPAGAPACRAGRRCGARPLARRRRTRGGRALNLQPHRTLRGGSRARVAEERGRRALAELGGPGNLPATVFVLREEDAARHLFRVAAGLESTVLGDTDVAAQVRRAHAAALAAGTAGPLLDRLFAAASAASKRVRSETSLSSGSTSIPSAALAVAARIVAPWSDCRLLVVGAGSVARRAALLAHARGCREIVVANRTIAHVRELTAADMVVSATGSRGFVLTAEHAAAWAQGASTPLAIFDLALPRDVAPALRDLHGSHLFDLDDLARVVAANGATRCAAAERGAAIVDEEAARYEEWRRARAAAPAIATLRGGAEAARRAVLARHAGGLARLAPEQRALLETITTQLVTRLLHAPTLDLRRRIDASDDKAA